MPLTKSQSKVAKLLAVNRSEDSYLAGGAALHMLPNSMRYSNDLDFFNDSVERVAGAFSKDRQLLIENGYDVIVEISQPGYIRTSVTRGRDKTKVDWAHDTAWRFMPTIYSEEAGYILHPVDLAINKLLALVGRDEARDFLDIQFISRTILCLGALIWAAAGKDPGFSPHSLLELLRRRGRYHDADFKKLHLTSYIDLKELKEEWLYSLESAESFINSRPISEVGCLYYSIRDEKFISPSCDSSDQVKPDYIVHYGKPGGVLPIVVS